MGEERSYAKVAAKFGLNKMTIYDWSKKFNWRKRILDRNLTFAEKLEQGAAAEVIGIKVEYSRAFGGLIKDFLLMVEDARKERTTRIREWEMTGKGQATTLTQQSSVVDT